MICWHQDVGDLSGITTNSEQRVTMYINNIKVKRRPIVIGILGKDLTHTGNESTLRVVEIIVNRNSIPWECTASTSKRNLLFTSNTPDRVGVFDFRRLKGTGSIESREKSHDSYYR